MMGEEEDGCTDAALRAKADLQLSRRPSLLVGMQLLRRDEMAVL